MTSITKVIIDRPVEIAHGQRTPALNHLRRHFRIEGIAELPYTTSLRDALAACGIESSTSGRTCCASRASTGTRPSPRTCSCEKQKPARPEKLKTFSSHRSVCEYIHKWV